MITGKCTYFDRIKEICSQLCFPKIHFLSSCLKQNILNIKTSDYVRFLFLKRRMKKDFPKIYISNNR